MGTVVVTKVDGAVDYITSGGVSVVVIDFDRIDKMFPDELDELIVKLHLAPEMPWRQDLLHQLRKKREECTIQ